MNKAQRRSFADEIARFPKGRRAVIRTATETVEGTITGYEVTCDRLLIILDGDDLNGGYSGFVPEVTLVVCGKCGERPATAVCACETRLCEECVERIAGVAYCPSCL